MSVLVPELSAHRLSVSRLPFASKLYSRSKFAGMNSKELKRLKELEEENRKLKQMYASLALDHELAKEIIEKKLFREFSIQC